MQRIISAVRKKNTTMNAQITQIAERLRGLRDALNLTVVQAAEKCGVSEANYALYESGTSDIPMSFICEVAQTFGVETSALFSGDDAHSLAYFVTRKGTGTSVERTKCYKYQSLAHGFRNAKVEPFEVTVEPCHQTMHLNTHSGQEFNLVLEVRSNYVLPETILCSTKAIVFILMPPSRTA